MNRQVVMIEVQPTATGVLMLQAVIERGFELLLLTDDEPWFRNNFPHEMQTLTKVIPVKWEFDKRAQIMNIISSFDRRSLAGIMTVRDRFVEAVSEVAAEFGLPFTNSQAVAICRNKERTRRMLDQLGIRNPLHQIVSNPADARAFCCLAGFPIVLKPSKGSGSAGVTLCSDEAELEAILPNMLTECADSREYLQVEEFVPGPVVGVETITFQGHTKVLGFTDRGVAGPHPKFTAISWTFPAQIGSQTEKQLEEIVETVLTHIGYDLGFTHTEVVLSANGPVLVEINPRLPGVNIVQLMSAALGIDMIGIMVDLFTGKSLDGFFQAEYPARYGMTEFAVKPDRNGKVKRVAGIELARRYPGVVSVLEGVRVGDEVADRHHLLTFGARIFARGDTPFESLACARAASTAVQLEIED